VVTLDFNRVAENPMSDQLNAALDRAFKGRDEESRHYLGASFIGADCQRQIQFDWMCDSEHPAQLQNIFERGHFFEEQTRQQLKAAGFKFRPGIHGFSVADNMFRGHADGIIDDGPTLYGITYPCLWEHKALGQNGWRSIERDGLNKAYPKYAAQVAIYQAYLDVTTPALFTVTNANDCRRLHIAVPFNAERAQAWSDRAVAIIKATQAGQLLEGVADDPKDWRCMMCSHKQRCYPELKTS
jgi:hypothetical protein